MVGGQASGSPRAAFYDFDGTLASGNVVSRYAWLARQHPDRLQAAWRYSEALLGVPLWLLLDLCSRHLFNVVFFRLYRGLSRDWLKAQSTRLLEQQVRREECRFARERVAMDRAAGFRTVLVTGGIDILLAPTAADLGFDDMLGNRLVFRDGIATGEIEPPLLAGEAKACVLREYAAGHGLDMRVARAYSDSYSDLPMLRAVGTAIATNPDRRLRRFALSRGWPILDLQRSAQAQGGLG